MSLCICEGSCHINIHVLFNSNLTGILQFIVGKIAWIFKKLIKMLCKFSVIVQLISLRFMYYNGA